MSHIFGEHDATRRCLGNLGQRPQSACFLSPFSLSFGGGKTKKNKSPKQEEEEEERSTQVWISRQPRLVYYSRLQVKHGTYSSVSSVTASKNPTGSVSIELKILLQTCTIPKKQENRPGGALTLVCIWYRHISI